MRRYENVVQVRCLLEGVAVDDILADWYTLLGRYMERWGLDRGEVGRSEHPLAWSGILGQITVRLRVPTHMMVCQHTGC